jgi:hypothetical protein
MLERTLVYWGFLWWLPPGGLTGFVAMTVGANAEKEQMLEDSSMGYHAKLEVGQYVHSVLCKKALFNVFDALAVLPQSTVHLAVAVSLKGGNIFI